jgi:hypothetical protein
LYDRIQLVNSKKTDRIQQKIVDYIVLFSNNARVQTGSSHGYNIDWEEDSNKMQKFSKDSGAFRVALALPS